MPPGKVRELVFFGLVCRATPDFVGAVRGFRGLITVIPKCVENYNFMRVMILKHGIHLQCWEVLPFVQFGASGVIRFRVLGAQDLYTLL